MLFISVLIIAEKKGINSRRFFRDEIVGTRIVTLTVDKPTEAYDVWQMMKFRGRVIVSLGRRLNFVQIAASDIIPSYADFPIMPFNLPDKMEKAVTDRNFLFVSMKSGIARGIIHIVPEDVFSEKSAYSGRDSEVKVRSGAIDAPFLGSPRTITTLRNFRGLDEPALLYVNASFFRDREPAEVMEQLRRSGLTADYIVLCRSFDDDEVGETERRRLESFEMLLGGGSG